MTFLGSSAFISFKHHEVVLSHPVVQTSGEKQSVDEVIHQTSELAHEGDHLSFPSKT